MLTCICHCSLHGPVISASLESTQGTLQQRAGSRSLPSELGDDASQQEFSELSDDEEDLRLTKVTKPTYKRGRKVNQISFTTSAIFGLVFLSTHLCLKSMYSVELQIRSA